VFGSPNRFRELSQEYAQLEPVVRAWNAWRKTQSAIGDAELMLRESDADLREMAAEELEASRRRSGRVEQEIRVLLLPRDPNDEKSIFLEVRAGTGGDEAALFAGDLFRMYSRYAESRKWQIEILSESEGEHGGYKEIIARIVGQGAYSRLKFESGTHRVQRVPETESQGRIHTSACTVAVLPEVESVDSIEVNPNDLRIDTYRASGAGGQHINKTDSAVRITHKPSGIVVQCQTERSQHQNRDNAMKLLRAKLYEMEMHRRNEEKQAMEDSKADIGWGSQIRSYVLDQSRIKDLRTGVEISNTQKVLDGDLDAFIQASLKHGL